MSEQSPSYTQNERCISLLQNKVVQKCLSIVALTSVVALMCPSASVDDYDSRARNAAQFKQSVSKQQTELERLANAEEGVTGMPLNTLGGSGIRDIHALPGYGEIVGKSDQSLLRESVVRILRKPKTSGPGEWKDDCTGLKVEIDNQPYVATARHCVTYKAPFPLPKRSTVNIANATKMEYGIRPADANEASIAVADGVVMNIGTGDWALLRVADDSNTTYKSIPAVRDYPQRITNLGATVGQSTYGYSLPGAAHGKPVSGNGIYLGTAPSPDDMSGPLFDIIGLPGPLNPGTDMCNHGGSGSAEVLPSGHITGPLSYLNNTGYMVPNEIKKPYNQAFDTQMRSQFEEELHVDLDTFSTVCLYSTVAPHTLADLANGMNNDYSRLSVKPNEK